MGRALWLGLRQPKEEGVDHFPLIEILPLPYVLPPQETTYTLLTSQTAVEILGPVQKKCAFAVGQKTAKLALTYGWDIVGCAAVEQQEGLLEVLPKKGSFFWPRSLLARKVLPEALQKRGQNVLDCPLYTTGPTTKRPLPDLSCYDVLHVTSPSVAWALYMLYRKLPPHLDVLPIGPITASALNKFFNIK